MLRFFLPSRVTWRKVRFAVFSSSVGATNVGIERSLRSIPSATPAPGFVSQFSYRAERGDSERAATVRKLGSFWQISHRVERGDSDRAAEAPKLGSFWQILHRVEFGDGDRAATVRKLGSFWQLSIVVAHHHLLERGKPH
jgi:hypothetical protein